MHEALQYVVGTAIVDARFREQLLSRSSPSLNGFGLSREEQEAICSVRSQTMEGFARELHHWIRQNASTLG